MACVEEIRSKRKEKKRKKKRKKRKIWKKKMNYLFFKL
jgi:hypothetical protein